VPSGILNENVHCVIGNGVVVHLRGLLTEMQALRDAGVNYEGRLHLSDRAHIVFDFHQAIDGYQEKQLAGNKIGTTLKGIGPAYSSKTQRNGVRVGDLQVSKSVAAVAHPHPSISPYLWRSRLQDMAYFETRLRGLVSHVQRAYPGLEVDVEAELAYYKSIRDELLPLITDTVAYCNQALADGKDVLVEGANATSKFPANRRCFLSKHTGYQPL
jgi:adenylosuccinate synthase